MANKKITIEFLGDSKDLQNSINDVDGKSSKLGSTLGKVGKAAAVGLGAGLLVGGAALFKMTQGAIEDEAAQAKLAKTLENAAGATKTQVDAVETWISAQGKALGVTDDELRPALSKLVAATKDVGEAQRLTSLAMDISAGTGKSLEQVTTALMKAQNGSVAGLSKLGIQVKDSEKDAVALKAAQIAVTGAQQDYTAAVKEFGPGSQEAKEAAAKLEYRQLKLGEAQVKTKSTTIDFAEAQKRLADAHGGQAATAAETLEGKIDRLKLVLAEAGETIGAKLIPVVTKMADWFLNKGLPAVMAFGGWLGDHLPPIFEKVQAVIAAVMSAVNGDVSGNLSAVQGIFTSVTSIITSLWDKFGSTLVDYAVKTFGNLQQIIGGAFKVIQGIFEVFSSLLKGDWSGVWDGIQKILSGAWEVIKGVVKQALNILGTIFELGWTALKSIVSGVWDGIKALVANGIDKIVEWVRSIPDRFANGLGSLSVTLAGIFRDAMAAGRDKVVDIGGTIVEWIAGIPGKLLNLAGQFGAAGRGLLQQFIDGMKNAAGVIEGIAGNVWEMVRGLLNGAISKINSALEFTVSVAGKDFGINPPDIPALAKGGLVTRPTLALIGEDGPEAVVPLSRKHNPGGVMPGMGGGANRPILVQLMLPGGKVIEQLLIQHSRDTGRPLQVATLGPA